MPYKYVAKTASVFFSDDETHCSEKCRWLEGDHCALWDMKLLVHEEGPIIPPVCRDAVVDRGVVDAINQKVEELLNQNAALKAALGEKKVYCGRGEAKTCGRAAVVCMKQAPCEEQVSDPVQCQGFGGPCARVDAKRQRQNTAYAEEERNWATYCPACQKAADAHWKEKWDEYYSG